MSMHTALESMAIAQLQARLRGEVICPGDARYERSRRVWNGRINQYPALIVYCADPGDVLTTVDFARSIGLPITVRGRP
jgi:hypothetical protein